VEFVRVTTGDRFTDLRRGTIDLLTRNTIDTLERTTGTGIRDVAVLYLDRQVVVVPRSLNAAVLADLDGVTICTLRHTPYAGALEDWFGARNLGARIEFYDDQVGLYRALYDGTCRAVSQVMAPLAATIVASGEAAKYVVLPDLVALHPLAAFARADDDAWIDIVRWTFNALLHGEDLELTSKSVGSARASPNPEIRRLLGVDPGFGTLLGLDEAWAFNVLSQVGNYAELYERSVGAGSSLRFARGVNALWQNGGILFPMPMR
jgi:general L-amino acid transport system substrate-binding protein